MDIESAFKPESIKPIMTNIIPGATLLLPYFSAVISESHNLQRLFEKHEFIFSASTFVAIIAAGLIYENMGARIEVAFWSQINDGEKDEDWKNYLKQQAKEETIGMQYIHGVVLRMKFEASFAAAIISAAPGIILLKNFKILDSCESMMLILVGMIISAAYLIQEAKCSVNLLAKTRSLLYR